MGALYIVSSPPVVSFNALPAAGGKANEQSSSGSNPNRQTGAWVPLRVLGFRGLGFRVSRLLGPNSVLGSASGYI